MISGDRLDLHEFLVSPGGDNGIDIETDGLDRECESFSLATAGWRNDGTIWSCAFSIDRQSRDHQSEESVVADLLARTVFDPKYRGKILFHNAPFDLIRILKRFFTREAFATKDLAPISDTLTISRVLKTNKITSHIDPRKLKAHSLKYLAKEYFDEDHTTFEDVVRGGNIRLADINDVLQYNRKDAELTLRLHRKFREMASAAEWQNIEEREEPHLLNVLHLAWHGVPFDKCRADNMGAIIEEQSFQLERRIFNYAGRSFKVTSNAELAHAIFHNDHLSYIGSGHEKQSVRPIHITPNGAPKVDLDSLAAIAAKIATTDPTSKTIGCIHAIMQYLELSKAMSQIESLQRHAVSAGSGYRIFPNLSAEAVSGRLICTSPNLLGLSKKVFKRSPRTGLLDEIAGFSVRSLIAVDCTRLMQSIDINGLDLSVIASGAAEFNASFEWKTYFQSINGHIIDSHLAILQRIQESAYRKALGPIAEMLPGDLLEYWPQKPCKHGIGFIHKENGAARFIEYPADDGVTREAIKHLRAVGKQLNLGTAYLMGEASQALKIKEATGRPFSAYEAARIIENFYFAFPEIRLFQDKVANHVYQHGFMQSVFGRIYYADVWDDLNAYYSRQVGVGSNEPCEMICKFKGRYWLIVASKWQKEQLPVIEDMKYLSKPFGLHFSNCEAIYALDPRIFRPSMQKSNSKGWGKKSERNQEEKTKYALSRIAISHEIDLIMKEGASVCSDGMNLLLQLACEGGVFIPEKNILFYRMRPPSPLPQYFRFFKPLLRTVKQFFPNYCQGVAASVANMCLTRAREGIENLGGRAEILLFVHDQVVISGKVDVIETCGTLLKGAVEAPLLPFDITLTGELRPPDGSFANIDD